MIPTRENDIKASGPSKPISKGLERIIYMSSETDEKDSEVILDSNLNIIRTMWSDFLENNIRI